MAGWGVEDGLIGLAGRNRLGHLVVDLQDQSFGSGETVGVVALEGAEAVHDVVHIITVNAIQVEVRGVQFGPDRDPPLLVPSERRPIITEISRERFHVPRRVRKFKDAAFVPLRQNIRGRPWRQILVYPGRRDGKLFEDKEVYRSSCHLLANDEELLYPQTVS